MKKTFEITSKGNSNSITVILTFILIVRIGSYFMLSEQVAVTQALKVFLRLAVTTWTTILLVQLMEAKKKEKPSFIYEYSLSLFLYLAYLVMGVVSLLWTSSVSESLLHLVMDFETLLFCYLYIKTIVSFNYSLSTEPVRLSKIIAASVFLICTVFIMGKFFNPEKFYRFTHGGEEARLGGFIINPNELGMLIVIGISMAIIELKHAYNKWFKWVMMSGLVYALLLTGSRSSMIGLLLIILFFASQSKTWRMRLLIFAALIAVTPLVVHEVFVKQGNIEEVLNMTGRIPFWKDLLTINFPREPITGYGYMRIDYADKFESMNSYAGAMTHNTFLQALMGLGLVGLFIVLSQLVFTIHGITTNNDWHKRRLCIGLLIPVMINSCTEFGIFGETNYGILFYLFIVFSIVLKPVPSSLRIRQKNDSSSNQDFRPSIVT